MIVFLISGLALAGAAVVLASRAFVARRARAAATLRDIDAYGFPAGDAAGDETRRSVLQEVVGRIGTLVGRRMSEEGEAELRNQLVAAGLYRTHPRDFRGYRLLSAVGTPIFAWWATSSAGFPAFMSVAAVALSVFAGWALPMALVRNRAKRRLARIDRELPELIDLLVVTVEAGLGFNASLQTASERLRGPVGDELRLALQQQRMGLSPEEALRNMLDRCDTPAMRSFVRSTLQGEALGVSIGEVLRNLATEMRKRRRQDSEERAQKAPVKLLFPLIFLIFPAMFVVILGPAGFALVETLGGGS